MNIIQLLSEMYPSGIPPTEYARVVTLITRVGMPNPPPWRDPSFSIPPTAAKNSSIPRKPVKPPKRAASSGGRRGRPPTGTAVKDRMLDLLSSRREGMTVPELARELDAHPASVYTAITQIGAERVEEGGQAVIRLPPTMAAPAP